MIKEQPCGFESHLRNYFRRKKMDKKLEEAAEILDGVFKKIAYVDVDMNMHNKESDSDIDKVSFRLQSEDYPDIIVALLNKLVKSKGCCVDADYDSDLGCYLVKQEDSGKIV